MLKPKYWSPSNGGEGVEKVSEVLREIPLKELEEQTKELYNKIEKLNRFDDRDLAMYDLLVDELGRRGYEVSVQRKLIIKKRLSIG